MQISEAACEKGPISKGFKSANASNAPTFQTLPPHVD